MTRPVIDRTGPVCTVELAEPEKRNPLSAEVLEALEAVVAGLRSDASVRVVVLRGRGGSFSAGADLRLWPPPAEDWQQQRLRRGRWQRLLDDIEALPQVSLARLQGHVIGGAALLAISCDLRLAADDMQLRIPELELGIPLTWAGLPRLAREIGLPRARDLVLTGRALDAREALEWGLVTRVASADALDAAVTGVIQRLLEPPAAVVSMTRQSLAAIGRDRTTAAGWADVDVYLGALDHDESMEARSKYVARIRDAEDRSHRP